ncbi:hypothetical protein HHI36_012074 [Cryptolaemus montrouzieri]|uniref:Attacin C-terminal domain-containing protein n=1 Tax=Cryptolaemus montrouzieri TaxID=559131 RepID=A0ABD2NDP5_9CUCU
METSADVSKGPFGSQLTIKHGGTIYSDDKNRVTGGGFVSKPFHPVGPTTVGGNLGYEHIPTGSGINIGASNTHKFGTDVGASANANIWQEGNSRLDVSGNYSRHYGGPGGTGKPNWGVGMSFRHQF